MPSAQYTSIRDQVYTLTNKPTLTTETDIAIRQAVRAAHRVGKFWRDLVTVPLTSVAVATVQTIDLSLYPDFRQMASFVSPYKDAPFTPVDALSLVDPYGYLKQDVYYAIGTTLNVRAAAPSDTYTMTYWSMPVIPDITLLSDWVADKFEDYIVLHAAASVFAIIGEAEIKQRIESLAAVAKADLLADNVELIGR